MPDTFSISWQYDNFIMTFANGEVYMTGRENKIENWGVFFVGNRGSLQVNRQGYAVRPVVPHVIRKQGRRRRRRPPAASRSARAARRSRRAVPGRGPAAAAAAAGAAAAANLPPVEAKLYVNPQRRRRGGLSARRAHPNFLDCMKSRQKPNADLEIGYYAALPCLLALESLQKGKPLGWDAGTCRARRSEAIGCTTEPCRQSTPHGPRSLSPAS